jgi:hypothetical protein
VIFLTKFYDNSDSVNYDMKEYQDIINEYQCLLNEYQNEENENLNRSNQPNQNWLIIFGSVFSFFILLFILSMIIKND